MTLARPNRRVPLDAKGRPMERIMTRGPGLGNVTKPTKEPKGATSRRHALEVMALLYGWTTIVEVGVWKADTSVYLLDRLPTLMWIGVDAYAWQPGDMAEEGYCDYPGDMDARYRGAMARLEPFGMRATLVRADSIDGAAKISDASLDAVFLDADHRYGHVLADIDAWRPKVKPGGWVTGHDYDFEPVRRAVNERFPEGVIALPDRVWAVRL